VRSPVQALRDLVAEFRAVMREHEEFLLGELAPPDEAVARAHAHRAPRGGEHADAHQ